MTRPRLTTERLVLEPLRSDHAELLVAMNADPAVMRFISGESFSRERTLRSLPTWVADQRGLGFWAGFQDGDFVGVWCLERDRDGAGAAELSYRLPRSAWGRGLATEGAAAVLDHGFGTVGLQRVWAETMAVNRASRAVLERLGFTFERSLPGDPPTEGWEEGEVVYAVDRATWARAAT